MGKLKAKHQPSPVLDRIWSEATPVLASVYRRALKAKSGPAYAKAWGEFNAAIGSLYILAHLHGSVNMKNQLPATARFSEESHPGILTIGPFREAIAAVLSRHPVDWRTAIDIGSKASKFSIWVTGIERRESLVRLQIYIAKMTEGTESLSEHAARAALGKAADALTDARMETIVRTNTMVAYADGQAAQGRAMREHIALYRLDEVHDKRTRGNPSGLYPDPNHPHYQMDGFMESPESPVWSIIWPPNGYNCRATITPITWPTAERTGFAKDHKIIRGALAAHNGRRVWFIEQGLYPDPRFKGPKKAG